MIKKPWHDNGTINYGETIKITLLIMIIIIPLSTYLNASMMMHQASPFIISLFFTVLFIQQVLFHYLLLLSILDYINLKLITLLKRQRLQDKPSLKRACKARLSDLFIAYVSHLNLKVIRI
jgi:isoprenylcysteine carboxyl methyltransferase (ICMT) family protein YpbQ